MSTHIPSAEEVGTRLKGLRLASLQELAHQSGVPYRTLLNIRLGATPNPGLETVRKFFHLLPAETATNHPHPAQAAQQGAQ
jgi:hypothetical protein